MRLYTYSGLEASSANEALDSELKTPGIEETIQDTCKRSSEACSVPPVATAC